MSGEPSPAPCSLARHGRRAARHDVGAAWPARSQGSPAGSAHAAARQGPHAAQLAAAQGRGGGGARRSRRRGTRRRRSGLGRRPGPPSGSGARDNGPWPRTGSARGVRPRWRHGRGGGAAVPRRGQCRKGGEKGTGRWRRLRPSSPRLESGGGRPEDGDRRRGGARRPTMAAGGLQLRFSREGSRSGSGTGWRACWARRGRSREVEARGNGGETAVGGQHSSGDDEQRG